MSGWISFQRIRLSNNKVPALQEQKLNEIGVYRFGQTSDRRESISTRAVPVVQSR